MNRIGIPFALLSAVLFGASAPLAKLLLGSAGPWMTGRAALPRRRASASLTVHLSRAALGLPA